MKCRGQAGKSCSVDETSLKVHGKWCYLYRAIDQDGHLVDSLLSEKRTMEAAKRFDLCRLLLSLAMFPIKSRPMGIFPLRGPSARQGAAMSSIGQINISIIGWSKTTVASNNETLRCMALGPLYQRLTPVVHVTNYTSISALAAQQRKQYR